MMRLQREAELLRLQVLEETSYRFSSPVHSIAYRSLPSPLGTLWMAVGNRGLLALDSAVDEVRFCWELERAGLGLPEYCPDALGDVAEQLDEYFAGRRRVFDVPIDLSSLKPFPRTVLEAVAAVPYGETRSYRDIAVAAGRPRAARAVGAALATSPISSIMPCHRIIRSDGTPGEYGLRSLGSCGAIYKLSLLAVEGVSFRNRE